MWNRLLILMTVVWVFANANQASAAQSAAESDAQAPGAPASAEAVFEIRSYHFNPALLDDYRTWVAEEALPYISEKIDVVGFWIANSEPPVVIGPPLDELGTANVTWIIRWPSMEERHKGIAAVFSGPEWDDIFSRVPGGPEGYLRIESRFANAVP